MTDNPGGPNCKEDSNVPHKISLREMVDMFVTLGCYMKNFGLLHSGESGQWIRVHIKAYWNLFQCELEEFKLFKNKCGILEGILALVKKGWHEPRIIPCNFG